MSKKIIATGFVLLSFLLPLKVMAASFDGVYVFGDSLSDDGNVYNATGGSQNPTTAIPENPPYYQGHYSNGPIWTEYLAQDLGLTPNPKTNFAFGGAGSGDNSTSVNPLIPGLITQVSGFKQQLKLSGETADPNAVYTIWAGANDYLAGGVTDFKSTVTNISTAVSDLASVGAKDILVVNLPNLGILPATSGNPQRSIGLSALTNAHNSFLASTLNSLSQQLSPEHVNIIPLDVNSLFNDVIAHPGNFGFTNVTNSCLSPLGAPVMGSFTECATTQQEQNSYLFWDALHPTTAGHEIIAQRADSLLEAQSVPEPSGKFGVLALCGLGAISLYKRKQKKASPVKVRVSYDPHNFIQ